MKRFHILYGKKLLPVLILLLLVLSLLNALSLNMVGVFAGEYPAIYIDPATTVDSTLAPGKNYTISIKTDYNGSDIWGWKFTLTYNPNVLHGGIRKTDTWTSFPNNTNTWTGDNNTRIFYTYKIRNDEKIPLKPVVPDSEKVYVDLTLMTKPANYTIDYPEGKLTFTTAPGLEANVTAIYQHLTFSTTGTRVVPDSEKVYVNQTLMTRIERIREKWIGNGETRTFYTTHPIFPGRESVFVNRMPPSWWGLNYTIVYSTGKITFDPAPWMGAEIKVAYDIWGDYTVDYSENTITFEIGSQPPEGVEIEATYLYGGVTNGDLITKDKHPSAKFFPGTFNNTIGNLSPSGAGFYASELPVPTTSGPGTLANVTFTVVGKGISNITLGPETVLLNPEPGAEPITDHTQPGDFDNRFPHDVAVDSVTAQAEAMVGFVSIDVEVVNFGKSLENVEVAVFNDSVPIGTNQNLSILQGKSETASFSWNAKGLAQGIYTINATATIPDDGDPTDNWKTTTFLVEHDIAVGSVTAPAKAPVESLVPIRVEVVNIGSLTELANVTIRHDSTYIDSQNVTVLVEESETALLSWNTTGLTKGIYTINATATIPDDGDPTDNWNTTTTFLVEHDIAVGSVTALAEAAVGDLVFINVTVTNVGANKEDVNVTIRHDSTYIDSQNVTVLVGESETALLSWNTTGLAEGNYILNATATVPMDDDPTDNWNTTTFLLGHDVAIISLDAPAEAAVGDTVPVSVGVVNIGSLTEVANVTIRHDSTYIDSQNVTVLVGESETALLSWNTTGLAEGNYILNATATVEGDVDPTNNWNTTTILLALHDVAVKYISTPTSVDVGELVTIRALVENLGGYNETFEVKITYDANAIGNQSVTLLSGASEYIEFSWDTTGVAPASYEITAEAILDGDVDPTNDIVTRSLTVELPLGAIAGTVTDSLTDDPIEGANVTANGYSDITDANGHYNITDVPAETYSVTVSAAGYEGSSETNVIVFAGETTPLNFTLTPLPTTGTITGTVTDSSTEDPIAGATVTANNASVSTGTDGSYIIELEPGTYTVTASADGYESSSKTDIIVVAGNTTQVDFELTPVQPLNILLYAGVAAIAIIIVAAMVIYILKVRKPKPT